MTTTDLLFAYAFFGVVMMAIVFMALIVVYYILKSKAEKYDD
jgi:cbb3-type cytochrome oxidase subunit 3